MSAKKSLTPSHKLSVCGVPVLPEKKWKWNTIFPWKGWNSHLGPSNYRRVTTEDRNVTAGDQKVTAGERLGAEYDRWGPESDRRGAKSYLRGPCVARNVAYRPS